MIGDFTESHLLSVAEGVVQKKTAGTALLDTKKEARIPKFKLQGTTTNCPFYSTSFYFSTRLPILFFYGFLFYILISIARSSCKNYLHCLD